MAGPGVRLCLRSYPQGCPRNCSNAGPISAKRSRTWLLPMPISASPRRCSFRKSHYSAREARPLGIASLASNIPAPLGIGSYSAGLSQPIFEGGALRNNLRYAKSQERQALIGYQQTIRQAFGDVSDALIGYDKYHSVRERQEQSVKDLAGISRGVAHALSRRHRNLSLCP